MAAAATPLRTEPSTTVPDHSLQLKKSRFLPSTPVSIPQPTPGFRSGHLNLDTFSPVNQNGSFEFDRVLKSGEVFKRTRKTKQWKSYYLVLRPNLLSVYKSSSEERLHKQISLSDLTAVTYRKDPKGRRQNIFGLFSPSQNFYLQARDEDDARSWVELIKLEARIEQEEQEIMVGSPVVANFREGYSHSRATEFERWDEERLGSSSPEPCDVPAMRSIVNEGVKSTGLRRPSAQDFEYSGDDLAPSSDFSDTALPQRLNKPVSESVTHSMLPGSSASKPAPTRYSNELIVPGTARNGSVAQMDQDEERVIWHGYLLCLKSKGGVRQWKRHWAVLRPKNLAFYKSEEEYAAHLIIPLSNIVNAVEIDPVSKSKSHCMQIIAEERNYRFCAPDEEALAKWLGALKTHLARRKEASHRKNITT